jgi:formate dehydrogenase subunit gamma
MSAPEPQILPNGRVVRYSFHERVIHWIAGFSYIYLMLTGLAFWSPWLFWIAMALGGTTVSRELHPWAGLIFVASTLMMYSMWGRQMKKVPSDKAFWDAVPHYVRNEDELVPSADRFNAGQKLLFWGFLWCGIALLLSGLVLWFTHLVPWNLRYLRYAAVIVHPVSALLTIGLFIIHVYMGTAMERGAFGSMTRGEVSGAWAKKYHRVWYDRLPRSTAAKTRNDA